MITDQPVNETFCPDGFVGLNDPECEKKTKINDTIQVTAPDFFSVPRDFLEGQVARNICMEFHQWSWTLEPTWEGMKVQLTLAMLLIKGL